MVLSNLAATFKRAIKTNRGNEGEGPSLTEVAAVCLGLTCDAGVVDGGVDGVDDVHVAHEAALEGGELGVAGRPAHGVRDLANDGVEGGPRVLLRGRHAS